MGLSREKREKIENLIESILQNKLKNHNPETSVMPFHTRLLGRQRVALYSFIHSLSTSFGVSIFEPVAVELVSDRFGIVKHQYAISNQISVDAQSKIQDIMDGLNAEQFVPNQSKEVEAIRKVCQSGDIKKTKSTRIDVYLEDDNTIYLIDIKTAKPNKVAFKSHKQTLLEWIAKVLFENTQAQVQALVAIPYNPYAPKEYDRWTLGNMLDLTRELKVAEEFWNFVAGGEVYDDLLNCFERVGIRMKPQIDDYFEKFNN